MMNEFLMKKMGIVKIVFEFPVLWEEWEMDGKGYVVETEEGTTEVLLSNHNCFHFASKNELEERINVYKSVMDDTQEALRMMK